ncbi:DinB family protein [Robertmurraya sp. Marseille-Q9965]
MLKFFEYNWQVRDEWFEWCKQVPEEELLKKRVGGLGNILHTLIHIADVEYSWLYAIEGKVPVDVDFSEYETLEKVKEQSDKWHIEVREILRKYTGQDEVVTVPWNDEEYKKTEVIQHIIAHEIHHIGQLSVWAREIGLKPVSPNFIGRGLQ